MSTTALEKAKTTEVVAQSEVSDPFLAMIERASSSPDFNDSKMALLDKLVDLRNKEIDRVARVAFATDFALMQPKLPTISRNGRIEVREKDDKGKRTGEIQQSSGYALWADIQEACKPHMMEHGFGISFEPENTPEGKIVVTAILSHRGGYEKRVRGIPLQHDSTGSKNAVQAVGSSLSYGMRYAGILSLGISSKENDDDKGGAPEPEVISDEQLAELQALMKSTDTKADKFCDYLKIDVLGDLRADRFDYAMAALRQKQTSKPKEAAQ